MLRQVQIKDQPLQILLIQVELRRWNKARSYSYCFNFGFEESLQANGVEVLMVTTPWISQVRKICGQRRFDQVWLNDMTHMAELNIPLDDIVDLAPIRIGFVTESLEYQPEEYAEFEWLYYRQERIERPFPYVTHLVAVDEKDVPTLAERYQKPTMWFPGCIPERMIAVPQADPTHSRALFCGSPYGQRAQWLQEPLLRELLTHQKPTHNVWLEELLFNLLPGHGINRIIRGRHVPARLVYPVYLNTLRQLRQQAVCRWQEGLQAGAAVVNLPHLIKAYSSRVIEGIASGRPVISWEIPDRPLNKALFEQGKEILLYKTSSELASYINHVLYDHKWAREIAENAQRKVRKFHIAEKRMDQILRWVNNGEIPSYGIDAVLINNNLN